MAVTEDHKIQWKKPKINLIELATLRWIEKWTVQKLSERFDRRPDTIQMYICRLKRPGAIEALGLNKTLTQALRLKASKNFKGKTNE